MQIPMGSSVGGYTLKAQLGAGAMGAVYLARHRSLPRDVAVKVLHPAFAAIPEFRARFELEADILSALDHPNIVGVQDRGQDGDLLYIVMEYVDGPDLHTALVQRGPFRPKQAVETIAGIAAALDHAHSRGLLHRDVKPANILLKRRPGGTEQPMLTDFGIAKNVAASSPLTRQAPPATVAYAAPEQLSGQPLDGRVDIYSLGAVLFELLTGRRAFPVEDVVPLMAAVLTGPVPDPRTIRSDVPPALAEAVVRALAKDPADRPGTGAELVAAISGPTLHERPAGANEPLLQEEPPAEDPGGRRTLEPATNPGTALTRAAQSPASATVVPPSRLNEGWPFSETGNRLWIQNPCVFQGDVPHLAQDISAAPSSEGTGLPATIPPEGLRVPLRATFRFEEGPLPLNSSVPYLGDKALIESLRERLQHSPGGSILVTGFPGVGKTTMVNHALAALERHLRLDSSEPVPLIQVRLNIARPISSDELLVKLIRNLYEALESAGALARLPAGTRSALDLAYHRTASTLKQLQSQSREQSAGFSLSLPRLAAQVASPTISLGQKSTGGWSTEAQYLPYSLVDAEHDLSRILLKLTEEVSTPPSRRWWKRGGANGLPWAGRLVVVLDELDKLTATEGGQISLIEIVASLKNLLTTLSVHFVFIGGPDLHDLAETAHSKGNGVLEGVFAFRQYVSRLPAQQASQRLVSTICEPFPDTQQFFAYCSYLDYRGRGIPRLLVREINRSVSWRNGRPTLDIRPESGAKLAFFAWLGRRMTALQKPPATPYEHEIEGDRFQIAGYLIVDWAIARGGGTFSAHDIETDSERRPDVTIMPPGLASRVLAALADSSVGILEEWDIAGAAHTRFDIASPSEPVYRVSSEVLSAASRTGSLSSTVGTVSGGRYRLLEEVGRGALGRTYRAHDEQAGAIVAVKLFDIPAIAHNARARERFRREVLLARRLRHPCLAAHIGVSQGDGEPMGLVSEFIEGPSLATVVARAPIEAECATAMTLQLLDLLAYLDEQGVTRIGIKPSSIVVRRTGQPALVNLGTARIAAASGAENLTSSGAFLGTPLYAAPEQLSGTSVDIRCDIYSLGLVFFEMLTGVAARRGGLQTVFAEGLHGDVDVTGLACSPELRSVIAAFVERDIDRRPCDPKAAAASLRDTPEGNQAVRRLDRWLK